MQGFPSCGFRRASTSVVPVTQDIDPIKEQVNLLLSDVRLGLLDGVKTRVDCARSSLALMTSPLPTRPTTPVLGMSNTYISSPLPSRPTTPVPGMITNAISIKPTTVSSSRPGTPVLFVNEKPPTLDECTDTDSMNPLHLAALGGHLAIVKFLVSECRVNMNKTTRNGNTALHIASEVGHSFVIEFLGDNGADMDCINHLGWTPLHLACLWNHFFVVEYFAKRYSTCHDHPIYSSSTSYQPVLSLPLFCCIFVVFMTSQKVDVNRVLSDSGRTPLILAAYSSHLTVCQCLVENGAHVGATDNQGRSALWWAAYMGHVEIIDYLLETAGVDHTQTNADGNGPLHAACMREKVEAIMSLINHGVNGHVTNNGGFKPSDLINDESIKAQYKAEMVMMSIDWPFYFTILSQMSPFNTRHPGIPYTHSKIYLVTFPIVISLLQEKYKTGGNEADDGKSSPSFFDRSNLTTAYNSDMSLEEGDNEEEQIMMMANR